MSELNAANETTPIAIEVESRQADLWESRIAPMLDRHFLVLCLLLVGIACARIIAGYSALSITLDEPVHFASGLEYLETHVYQFDPQHPPLSRVMEALGPYLAGARMDKSNHDFWQAGDAAIAATGNPVKTIFLMRLGNLPFFLLACATVCIWARYAFGKPVAVLATALFTLLPTILADAQLATTDLALGATVGAAFLAAMVWSKQPTLRNSLLMGLFAALACMSKFTALGYLPATTFLALLFYLLTHWPGRPQLWIGIRQRALPLAFAAGTCAVLIWGTYWFSIGQFDSHVASGSLAKALSIPAPAFFGGIRVALHHNRDGHPAFLLGQYRKTGWWYYFPVALAVKTPIAFLIFAAIGAFACWKNRQRPEYLFPLAFCLGIMLPVLKGRIDIGIRHIEPIYLGLSILSALGLRQLFLWGRSRIAFTLAGCALVAWMALSGAMRHPDYLTYFNAFAGTQPDKILVDSNYDWGQDMGFLAERFHQMGVQQFTLASLEDPRSYHYLEDWYGLPIITQQADFCQPSPGWTVVSPTFERSGKLMLYADAASPPACLRNPWYDRVAPSGRVGSLRLYYTPPPVAEVAGGHAAE